MEPTLNAVHIDAALTRLVVNYRPQQYVADLLFPVFKVDDETGKIWKIDRTRMSGAHGSTTPDGKRSLRSEDGTARSIGGFGVSTGVYRCEEYALNDILFDRIKNKAAKPLRLRQNLAQAIVEQLIQDREFRAVDLITTGNLASGHNEAVGATKWTAAGADLLGPVDNAKKKIREATLGQVGPEDLTLLMSWNLFLSMKNNTDVQDRLKYTQSVKASDITPALMAQYWGIGDVKTAGAYFNSAGEAITESLTQFWPDSQVFVFYNTTPDQVYKGFGQTFSTLPGGRRTRTWRDTPRKGEVIENELVADENIVNNDAGYLITAATS